MEAVAEPLAILGATVDGTFVNFEPSPVKYPLNAPVNEPV